MGSKVIQKEVAHSLIDYRFIPSNWKTIIC